MRCKECHIYKTHLADITERIKDIAYSFVRVFGKKCKTDEIGQLYTETSRGLEAKRWTLVLLRDTKCPEGKCILCGKV